MTVSIFLFFLCIIRTSASFVVNNNVLSSHRNVNIAEDPPMSNRRRSLEIYSVTKSQTAILDGSSFNALDTFLAAEGKVSSTSSQAGMNAQKHGYCSFVTAKLPNNERVVGIRVDGQQSGQENDNLETVVIDEGVEIYKDSLATIPKSISDDDAISTAIASMASVHCAVHNPIPANDKIVQNVGGSSENFVSNVSTKIENNTIDNKIAVVVGGGDFASFVAE